MFKKRGKINKNQLLIAAWACFLACDDDWDECVELRYAL